MAGMNLSVYRYPGAKNKLLPLIEKHIDNVVTDSFADCFTGGGSVLLHVAKKYPKIKLYANDKNYNIYSFWKLVSGNNDNAINQFFNLIDIQPTLELFYKLKEESTSDIVRSAYIGLFLNKCSFSGIGVNPIGGKNQASKYTVDCRYNAKNIKAKILEIRKLLQGRTEVDNSDIINYDNLSSNIPIYLDPPYFIKGKDLYSIYMKNDEHVSLSNILKGRKNWVLSYDDCEEIRSLYKGYRIIDINAKYSINGKKTKWSQKNELLIIG
jgi:DNA adenine methylase